jgi:hypothetical protein
LRLLIGIILALHGNFGFSEVFYDDFSFGKMALDYHNRNRVWGETAVAGVDGTIVTNPPGTKEYNRKLESLTNMGFDRSFGRIGTRFNLKSFISWQKTESSDVSNAVSDEHYSRFSPSLDATFITSAGLEISLGSVLLFEPEREKRSYSSFLNQSTKYSSAKFSVPRLALIRRGGNWNGGIYYSFGKNVKRSVALSASDGTSLNFSEYIHSPTEFGIISDFNLFGLKTQFDGAQIQSVSTSGVSTDGKSIEDDYLRLRISTFLPLGAGLLNVGLGHKTVGYSSNTFATFETIPASILNAKYLLGSLENHLELGAFYVLGSDKLSIPEANESFHVKTVGMSLGLVLSI